MTVFHKCFRGGEGILTLPTKVNGKKLTKKDVHLAQQYYSGSGEDYLERKLIREFVRGEYDV